MGGRGGSSGLNNEKPVSKLMSKVYFSSAKKSDALRGSGTVKKTVNLRRSLIRKTLATLSQLRQKVKQ